MRHSRRVLNLILALRVVLASGEAGAAPVPPVRCVGKHKMLEVVATAAEMPANPFATYLLKLEVTDPAGRVFTVDGFYDGEGDGGQTGRTWKARLCPYRTGRWAWHTVPGVDSQKSPEFNQRYLFAPGPDYTRYNVEAFRAIDAFIDALRQADIVASPYLYYDPRREVLWKMTPEQDRAYIRYAMARIGGFGNVMTTLPYKAMEPMNEAVTRGDAVRYKTAGPAKGALKLWGPPPA